MYTQGGQSETILHHKKWLSMPEIEIVLKQALRRDGACMLYNTDVVITRVLWART